MAYLGGGDQIHRRFRVRVGRRKMAAGRKGPGERIKMGFRAISRPNPDLRAVRRRVQMFVRLIPSSTPNVAYFFVFAIFSFSAHPRVHLIPISTVPLVSCLLNVPESSFSSLFTLVACTCWWRARGRDQPTGGLLDPKGVHRILRRPDKRQLQFPFGIYRISRPDPLGSQEYLSSF